MSVFESYIFEEDEVAANNEKVLRQRPYLIAVITIFTAATAAYLGLISIAIVLGLIFIVILTFHGFGFFNPKMKTGDLKRKLKITEEGIYIDNKVIEFNKVLYVKILIKSHQGQIVGDRLSTWKSKGVDNWIQIEDIDSPNLLFQFWLPTYKDINTLQRMDFPDNVKVMR